MIDFELFNNKIIIAPNCLKPYILNKKRLKPHLNFKIFSLEELQEIVYGRLKNEALLELFKNSDYDYEYLKGVTKLLLKGFNPFFNDDFLKISNLLKDLDLIKKDDLKINYFINKEVIFINYLENNNEVKNIIKELYLNNCLFLSLNELFDEKEIFLNEFDNVDEELRFNLFKICDLLNKGIKPKDIILITDTNNNEYLLKIFSREIGLNLNFSSDLTLNDTYISKIIENNLLNINKENIDLYDDSSEEFKTIKDILDKYDLYSNKNKLINYKAILKDYPLKDNNDLEGIKVTNKLIFNDEKYIFLTTLDNHFYSKISKNNDLIDDSIKENNNISTSDDLNLFNNKLYSAYLNLSDKLNLSYSKTSFLGNEFISFYFISKYKNYHKFIKKEELNYSYSKNISLAYYSHLKYLNEKFNLDSLEYELEKNTFKILDKYDNSFKSFKRINTQNVTSYTDINSFFECPFKYYLSKILKIDEYEETFVAKAGKYIHEINESIYDKDFDFDKKSQELLNKYQFNKKEEVFIEKLVRIAKIVALRLIKERNNPYIIKEEKERNLSYYFKPDLLIKGKIDSMLISEKNNIQYMQIIDYKTGKAVIDSRNYDKGLNLQLPIYISLIKNSEDFKNININGIYILSYDLGNYIYYDDINFENKINEAILKTGETSLDLEGFLSFEPLLIDYLKSKTVNKLEIKKGKLNSKGITVIDEPCEIEDFIYNEPILNQLLDYFYDCLTKNDFKISPYKKGYNDSCKYCSYKDICYKKEYNVRNDQGLFELKKELKNTKDE